MKINQYLKTSALTLLIFSGIVLSDRLRETDVLYYVVDIPSFTLLMRVCYLAINKS